MVLCQILNTLNYISKPPIGCNLFYHKTGSYCANQLALFEALTLNCGNWQTLNNIGHKLRTVEENYTATPPKTLPFIRSNRG